MAARTRSDDRPPSTGAPGVIGSLGKRVAKSIWAIALLALFSALLLAAARGHVLPDRARKFVTDLVLAARGIDHLPAVAPCGQGAFPDAVVVRIEYRDDEALHALLQNLDVWFVDPEQQSATAMVSAEEQQWLTAGNYPFAEDLEATAALPDPCAFQARKDTVGIPGYACYRTVEETYRDLATLAAQYPRLAEWKDYGNSWLKVRTWGLAGDDLHVLVLTNPNNVPEKGELVVMGALHPRELVTAELATRFAELLLAGYGTDADLTWLLDYNRVHIIPLANPDGRAWVEKGYLWRKNANNTNSCRFPLYGVDLNRNSSFLWNHCHGCSSGDVCSVFFRGRQAASEPETRAIEAYLTSIFEDRRGEEYTAPAPEDTNGIFISLHSYGRLLLYPWEHASSPAPNRDALRRLGRKLGYAPGYKVCNAELCLYRFDGSTPDFAYGTLGVASFTYEIGTAFFESCSNFASSILNQNLESLLYAAKAARRPYQLPAGPDVAGVGAAPQSALPGTTITLAATADDTRSAGTGSDREPSQPIAAARFSVNSPSWLAASFGALQPLDGAFDSAIEKLTGSLDTSHLPPGKHIIFVEAQDAAGNWGPPGAVFVTIEGPTPEPTSGVPRQPETTPARPSSPTRTPSVAPSPAPAPTPYHLYLPNLSR